MERPELEPDFERLHFQQVLEFILYEILIPFLISQTYMIIVLFNLTILAVDVFAWAFLILAERLIILDERLGNLVFP